MIDNRFKLLREIELRLEESFPEAEVIKKVVFRDAILALIDQECKQTRLDELNNISNELDSLHQTTEGAGFVHYGEFGEYLDDRIKELEKE